MKKFLKHLLLSLLLFIPFMVSKATVSFAYVDDHIQNNTKDTAYELKENTLQDVLSQYNRRVFNCFLENSNDIGWFKTYLSNGDKTLTINIDVNSTIEVISEKDDKVVFTRKYGRSIAKQGEFKITENGVYYIKVKPNEEVNKIQNFTMLVGEPDYSRKYFTKNINEKLYINSNYTTSDTVNFDLSYEDTIPNEAIVLEVSLNGTETNRYDAYNKVRYIKSYNSQWINVLGVSYFDKNILNINAPVKLKTNWSFKHSASDVDGVYALQPSIRFTYLCRDKY